MKILVTFNKTVIDFWYRLTSWFINPWGFTFTEAKNIKSPGLKNSGATSSKVNNCILFGLLLTVYEQCLLNMYIQLNLSLDWKIRKNIPVILSRLHHLKACVYIFHLYIFYVTWVTSVIILLLFLSFVHCVFTTVPIFALFGR